MEMSRAFLIAILIVFVVGGRLEAQEKNKASLKTEAHALFEKMQQQPEPEDLSHCIVLKGRFTPLKGEFFGKDEGRLYLEFLNKCSRSVFLSYCLRSGLSLDCESRGINQNERLHVIYPESNHVGTINRVVWEACQYKKKGYLFLPISGGSLHPSDFYLVDGPCRIDKRADVGFDNHHFFPSLPLGAGASLQPGSEVPLDER